MKKILLFCGLLLLVASVSSAQMRGNRYSNPSPLVPDGSGGYTLPGSLTIDGSTAIGWDTNGDGTNDIYSDVNANLYATSFIGGVSPFVLSGNSVFTTDSLNKTYIVHAGSKIFELPQPGIAGYKVVFIDNTKSGDDSGCTFWIRQDVAGVSIWNGIGSSAVAGQTFFWNSGNTGAMCALWAIDANTYRVLSSDATLLRP